MPRNPNYAEIKEYYAALAHLKQLNRKADKLSPKILKMLLLLENARSRIIRSPRKSKLDVYENLTTLHSLDKEIKAKIHFIKYYERSKNA